MRRQHLSVYGVSVCSSDAVEVPIARALAAIAVRGVPAEFPEFLPLVIARGRDESTLGHVRSGAEWVSALAAVGLAVKDVGGYWAAVPAVASLVLRMTRGRQEEIIGILTPLATRLLRPGEVLVPSRGACHTGMILSSGDVPYAEARFDVPMPDAPMRTMNYPEIPDSWARSVDVEFTANAAPPPITRR